ALPLKENFEEYDVKLKNILAEMRRNLATGHIPGIRKEQKCSGCSMKDLCMPSIKPVKDLQAEIEKIGKAEL
ncbi:CRISPR-associated protein Cas4, partial [Mediterraneibacter glycyrrhizinilyticus]|nr:CRISPR-associated protein Cas4 [Mediterraneibacter glycyrrhizinilyticus]